MEGNEQGATTEGGEKLKRHWQVRKDGKDKQDMAGKN